MPRTSSVSAVLLEQSEKIRHEEDVTEGALALYEFVIRYLLI